MFWFSKICYQINDAAPTWGCLIIKEIQHIRSAAQNEKMHFWKDVNSFKIICEFVLIPVLET